MITNLDTQSWSKELVTGNSQFVETAGNSIYVISQSRPAPGFGYLFGEFGYGFGNTNTSFVVLESEHVPPAPGPGSSFNIVASYTFPQPNTSFDPVTAFDPASGLLHIIGTRNTPISGTTSSMQTNDLIKFTYDTVHNTFAGPFVIAASIGSRVRGAYDIGVLDTGNTIVAAAVNDPTLTTANITSVSVAAGLVTVNFTPLSVPFLTGQWLLVDGLTNAEFLNGALVQVEVGTTSYVQFPFVAGNYPTTADTGTVRPVGSSLFAVELNESTNLPVTGTATILASSPSRSGNSYDAVSLVVTGDVAELYYQTHPRLITFADQLFTINLVGRNLPPNSGYGVNFGNNFGIQVGGFGFAYGSDFGSGVDTWGTTQVLTTFSARYSDNRMTVLADNAGNRYLSLTYYSQTNHPEGITGSVLVGNRLGSNPWFFHPTFGTTTGGSIIQSTLSIDRTGTINLLYLLQPFDTVSTPPSEIVQASWPLQVALVDPSSLALTNVPGFYNTVNFTWLRGAKSLVDNSSEWAMVGEREVTTLVTQEPWTIPTAAPFQILVVNSPNYFEDLGVVYTATGTHLTPVATNPQKGQYTVDYSIGLYEFNRLDAGASIGINYNFISAIIPVYASLFNVPPIARVTPTSATTWRGGTFYATDVRSISSFSITSNVITVIANNDFTSGQQIAIYNFANAANQFLNGITLNVATASSTQFTAAFTHPNYASVTDTGIAAALIPGTLTLSAAGTTDADNDAIQYIWTENDANPNVTLTTNGATAAVNVAKPIGPEDQVFDVGVATIDLFPDLVTQRHPALEITDIMVSGGVLTMTFIAPTGAIVPITGEQIMLYDMVLGPPAAPGFNVTPGGSLPAQGSAGFGSIFGFNFGEDQPLSLIVTYVNAFGETVGSANTLFTVPANNLLVVTSPLNAGDAEFYNVYVGLPGSETLQSLTPQLLGTNWVEPTSGFITGLAAPPTTSTAIQEFLNDQVFTLIAGTDSTTLVANITLGFGYDFGFDYGASSFPLTAVTGNAISQFQFQQVVVTVPENVAPVATFPAPAWNAGNVLASTLPRNTTVEITPTITGPNQYPIVYSGLTDPDDSPTYLWTQVSGTTVTLPGGVTSPIFKFDTNGVNINGEQLVFSVTLNDGINPPFTTDFTVNVAAYVFTANNTDTLQVSRSVFSSTASVTEVTIAGGIATFTTAGNTFTAGQTVWFEGMTANFLNGATYTILPTGFGSSFGIGYGAPSLSPSQFQIYDPSLPNYGPAADVGTAFSALPISARNTSSTWSPLDISIIYNNLQSVKRTSVLDGSDRYIVISPQSVLVYAVFPAENPVAILIRKLFLPNNNTILDAVHCEQDYTLVLDTGGNILRYPANPAFIQTDNPDVILPLIDFTSLSFANTDLANDVKITSTVSYGNQRVVVVSGEEGAVLLQMNTTTLAVTAKFELTVQSNFVYGANKVQFVRWVDMDSVQTGIILIGTILNQSAQITNVAITTNALTITCVNMPFVAGDVIVLSGLTNATFLNGLPVTVINTTATTFTASYNHADYASAADTGLAQSQNTGSTYETLINLANRQIIGTFDKSKLRNQFVETGEIMFDPSDPYAGSPPPPVLEALTTTVLTPTLTNVTLAWEQLRPDLITSYIIQMATDSPLSLNVPATAPYTFQVPAIAEFTADEGAFDTTTNAPLQATGQSSPLTGQYNATSTGLYTFNMSAANHTVVLSIRGAFNTVNVVNSGSVQTFSLPLNNGSTYFFQVQAVGLDGTSGFSNIQKITL